MSGFFCVLCRNLLVLWSTLQRLVEDEVWTVFVDCVVGEMHEHVFKIVAPWLSIGFSRQSGQPLLINKDP